MPELETKLEQLGELCRKNGIPLTIQRRTILAELLTREDHPTVDQLYARVSSLIPGVSRTTVYRVLDTFISLGIVRQVSHIGAQERYEARTDPHHHAVCRECGRIVDVEPERVANVSAPRVKGFKILGATVQFTGVCSECRNAGG